jgi:hypothetical protein
MSLYAYLWPTRVIDGAARDSSTSAQQSYLESGVAVGRLDAPSAEKYSPQAEAHAMETYRN